MSRRSFEPLATAIVVLAGVGWLASCGGSSTSGPDNPSDAISGDVSRRQVELYFPGADGRLHAEAREIPDYPRPEAAIAVLVDALLSGPQEDGLWPPLQRLETPDPPAEEETDATADPGGSADAPPPPAGGPAPDGARVGAIYLLDEDLVVLDLEAPAGPPAVGARQEELMLYSLVNSLLLNTPRASRMIVLWNGVQPTTFAGHIDTAQPLRRNCELIAPPRPAACVG